MCGMILDQCLLIFMKKLGGKNHVISFLCLGIAAEKNNLLSPPPLGLFRMLYRMHWKGSATIQKENKNYYLLFESAAGCQYISQNTARNWCIHLLTQSWIVFKRGKGPSKQAPKWVKGFKDWLKAVQNLIFPFKQNKLFVSHVKRRRSRGSPAIRWDRQQPRALQCWGQS